MKTTALKSNSGPDFWLERESPGSGNCAATKICYEATTRFSRPARSTALPPLQTRRAFAIANSLLHYFTTPSEITQPFR